MIVDLRDLRGEDQNRMFWLWMTMDLGYVDDRVLCHRAATYPRRIADAAKLEIERRGRMEAES